MWTVFFMKGGGTKSIPRPFYKCNLTRDEAFAYAKSMWDNKKRFCYMTQDLTKQYLVGDRMRDMVYGAYKPNDYLRYATFPGVRPN